ncbi:DUF4097 family beta strand repeat protein [Clostridium sp. 'deep sea']|uniref:DUF4097 family beta strand repeat-containing protein n=1 Tax=Clostridium sp. 'deep sea' TaxID=2779445 RepID=UPI001896A1A5|nr:DUF4097 family beta strand repeat-containing protein [Clostridium sp. 'deep sea']QOR35006.1 DUF4097 family beta strand repeat protein [Clostridium sp. 'deep sea']
MKSRIKVIIASLFMIVILVGCNIDLFGEYEMVSVDETVNDVTGIFDLIKVDVICTNINLVADDRDNILIKLTGEKSKNVKHQLKVNKVDDCLEILIDFNKLSGLRSIDFKLDIHIPKNYVQSMDLTTSSGDITIKDFTLDNLALDLSSGDSSLQNITSNKLSLAISSGDTTIDKVDANSFDFSASSGMLTANELTTDTFKYGVTSGDIKIEKFRGDICGEGSSADIEFNYSEFDNEIAIEATSGDVTINLPNTAEFNLAAKVSSGNIVCDFPILTQGKQEDDVLNGTVISADNKINIQTSSGDILIKYLIKDE